MRPPGALDAAVETTRQRLISAFASSLRRRVFALIEDPVSRVRGAVWAAQRCGDYCDTLRAQLRGMETTVEQQLQRIEREFSALASPAEQGEPLSDHDLRTLLESYSQRRTRQYIVTNSVAVVTALKGHMAGMRDELSELIRRARQMADLFEVDRVPLADHRPAVDEDAFEQLRSSTRNFLAERLPALIEHAEQMIEQSHEADTPSLQRLLTDSGPHIQQIPDQLRNFGRMAVRATMKELNAIEIMFGDDSDPATQTRVLNQCLDAVKPALAACGGAQRLLVMLPESSANPRPLALLHQTLNELPSATMIPTSDFVICRQIEQVPFTQVAVTLIEQRQDYVEFANRLHTRRDIPWSELPDLV